MKTIFALSMLALSSSAFASPAVGDIANFAGTAINDGNPMSFELQMKLTEYDATNLKYKRVQTTTMAGQTQTQEEWVSTQALPSDAMLDMLLANCAQNGGTAEKVTVPAGTFDTCRLNVEGGTANLGKVPFGIVKVSQQGVTAELVSLVRGQ